uniref:Uncharacterized protein n=1 Tax=Anguilla anguilla TaxID=7936 RepID=A0A0E9SGV2_ANGAN
MWPYIHLLKPFLKKCLVTVSSDDRPRISESQGFYYKTRAKPKQCVIQKMNRNLMQHLQKGPESIFLFKEEKQDQFRII